MKIVITGVAGLLGSKLAEWLIENTEHKIIENFVNTSNFFSLSVLSINAFPKVDIIFAVSAKLSPPLFKWSSSDLNVRAPPLSCLIAV